MVGYVLMGILLGGALGYSMFHFRYNDTQQIDTLRQRFKTNQDSFEVMQHEVQELAAQNEILKKRTGTLIQQNEDYSKLVSELSRYYFHIKEATHKVQELGKLLRVYDSDLDQKLTNVGFEKAGDRIVTQVPVLKDTGTSQSVVTNDVPKKYF